MTPAADPSRRRFLHAGGLTLALGTVASACRGDDDEPPSAAPDRSTPTQDPERAVTDVALLNTALSLEALTFDAYQIAVDGGTLERGEVVDALSLFRQHHAERRDALRGVVEAAGGEPFTTANPVVKVLLVDPGLSSVTEERDLVRLCCDLELLCAQLYVHAATMLDAPELRSTVMGNGAVASRRATYLDLLGDLGDERLARYPTTNPLPADAIVPD